MNDPNATVIVNSIRQKDETSPDIKVLLSSTSDNKDESHSGLAAIDLCNEYQNFTNLDDAYELYEKFAEGSQGKIFYGKDKILNRSVAVKSLKTQEELDESHTVGDTKNRRLFSEEAMLTAQLDHPSIIPIYSLNSDNKDGLHFSMKLIKGTTLRQHFSERISKYQQKSPSLKRERKHRQKRLEIFLKICDAMSYAHSRGIIHRDLKPENIMIGEFNEVYVMDWGIAVVDEKSNNDTQQLEASDLGLCGTPGYISPCLISGSKPSPQSDIYALGAILYEIVTLEKSYAGKNFEEIMRYVKYNDIKTVLHRFDHITIPVELIAIIEKACAYKKKDRYQSVYELASDIRRFIINIETRALPDNQFRKTRRWIQQNSSATILIFTGLLLTAACILIFALYQKMLHNEKAHQREQVLADYQSHVLAKAYKIDSYFINLENLLIDSSAKMLKQKDINLSPAQKVYSSDDFQDPQKQPKGLRLSKVFQKKIHPLIPGYKLSPNTKLEDVRQHLNHLYSFKEQYQNIMLRSQLSASRTLFSDKKAGDTIADQKLPIRFVYGGFENGVFFSFPGKGGYPKGYNHRIRPWYRQAISRTGLNWGEPYYDINGHGLLLPCTFTFKGKESHENGVLAIDVTLKYIVDHFMGHNNEKDFIEAAILDQDGKVIMSSNYSIHKPNNFEDDVIKSKFYKDADVLKLLRQGRFKQLTKMENGREIVYEIGVIPSLKWYYLERKEFKAL